MTRSIPSIIVLTLMCFTISYGIIQFPDAGILDASSAASADGQTYTAMKQPLDGSAIQQEEQLPSAASTETQAPSNGLFVTESSDPPTKGSTDSNSGDGSVDNAVDNNQEYKSAESNAGLETAKSNSPADCFESCPIVDGIVPNIESEVDADKSTVQNSELTSDALEEDKPLPATNFSDDNYIRDNSLPIESDQDPMPMVDPIDPEIPQIQIQSTFPEPIQEPEPISEFETNPDLVMPPEEDKSVQDRWKDYINSDPADESASNNGNSQTDSSTNNTVENEKANTTVPNVIKTDPNAQEIPPQVRENKPANTGALTQPAVVTPQNDASKSNRSDDRTIPLETFPLDNIPPQPVSYTMEMEQEPHDSLGFDYPASGIIVVKRLPSTENSVDPIYNNAQLDRFAL